MTSIAGTPNARAPGWSRQRIPFRGVEPALAVTCVALLGMGTTLAATGGVTGNLELAVAGGAIGVAALFVLLACGWLDGLTVLVLILPLPAPYTSPTVRLSLAVIVTMLVLAAWALGRAPDRRPLDVGGLPWWPLFCLMAAMGISTLMAEHRALALRELVNFSLFTALLIMATDAFRTDEHRVRQVARTVGVVAGVGGLLAVAQALGLPPSRFALAGTPFFRATLGFEWPNELAMFLGLGLPFSAYAYRSAQGAARKALAAAGLVGAIAGLAATFSRGSWLAVPAGALVLLFAGRRRFVLQVLITGAVAGVLLDILSGGALRQRAAATAGDWVLEQRLALTAVGLLMFRDNPIFGVGPGAFGEYLDRFGPQVEALWDYVGSAHNGFVHVAAETGVAGLLAMVALYGAILLHLVRVTRRAPPAEAEFRATVLWSFSVACAITFLEWPFAHGVAQIIMLAVAMGFAVNRRAP